MVWNLNALPPSAGAAQPAPTTPPAGPPPPAPLPAAPVQQAAPAATGSLLLQSLGQNGAPPPPAAPAAPQTAVSGTPAPTGVAPDSAPKTRGRGRGRAAAAAPPAAGVQQTLAAPAMPTPGALTQPAPAAAIQQPVAAQPVAAPPPVQAQPAAAPPAIIPAGQAGLALAQNPGSYLGALLSAPVSAAAANLTRFADKLLGGGGEPNEIPTVFINDVGMFDCDAMNVEGSDSDLPTGRDPFVAIFLGYRLRLITWPKAADRNSQNRDAPVWKAIVGSDSPAWDVAAEAVKDYQFTPKDARPGLYDPLGHPRGCIELLWWEPQAKLMVTRTQGLVNAMHQTVQNLAAALPRVRGVDGNEAPVFGPFPGYVAPGAALPQGSKGGQSWEEYPILITQQSTGDGQTAWQAFQQWIVGGGYTAEVDAVLKKWNTTTLTDQQLQTLQQVSAVKRARGRG